MPLARILTLSPDQADDFAQQLYDLGFEVEVVSPHEQSLGPADLEIEFAICDQQQILARAAAIATQLQAEVVVFPKAIPPLPKPIPIASEVASDFTSSLEEEETEDRRASEAMLEIPAEHPLEPDQVEFAGRVRALNQTADKARQSTRKALSALQHFAQDIRDSLLRLKPKIIHSANRTGTALGMMTTTVVTRFRAWREDFKLRLAEARADRQRRQAEINKRQAEAAAFKQEQQREIELAAAKDEPARQGKPVLAMSMQQQEVEHLRAENAKLLAEIERIQAGAKEQLALKNSQTAEEPQAQPGPVPIAVQEPVTTTPRRPRQLRGALAGAVTASFLLLAGVVLANFHTVTPLSRNLNDGSMEEQVPFGAATVHGTPGVTVGGSSAPKPSPETTAPATTTPTATLPQPQAPAQAQAQPAGTTPAPAKPSPEWHHFRRSSNWSEDGSSDDVVVRHFGPPRARTTQTAQRAEVKRYSDE